RARRSARAARAKRGCARAQLLRTHAEGRRMTTPTNHWKLGLFVVTASLVGLLVGVYLGTRTLPRETVPYVSYFDETVTGLDNGSPVRYRGVNIGNVSAIAIAPDRRHVEVGYELAVSVLGRMGLAAPRGQETKIHLP